MRVVLQPGFVLHARAHADTSVLLELITPDHGRVGCIARGARRSRSRWRGILQPLRPLLLSWSGRGELVTLTGAEEFGPPIALPPERVLSALYLNELLLRLLARHDPQPELFAPYHEALVALAAGGSEEPALRIFEKRLLALLGFGLVLDREVRGGHALAPDGTYLYILDRGPVEAWPGGGGIEISGRGLLALGEEALDVHPGVLPEVKRLTRAAIAARLEGRPLRTRELAAAWRRRPSPAPNPS